MCGQRFKADTARPSFPSQRGYTLIEVLLAAGIVLLAMSGILTMQLVGIKIAEGSYQRTQATTLAYQMTDFLRANCGATANYLDHTLCDSGARAANDKRSCSIDSADDLTEDTIVDQDLNSWWDALDASELPNWYATVARPAGSDLFHVIVQWDDTHATEGAADDAEAKTSCLGTAIPAPMEEVCLTTLPCAL